MPTVRALCVTHGPGDHEWVGHEKTGLVGDQPGWTERSLCVLVAKHEQNRIPRPLLAQGVTRTRPQHGVPEPP